MSTKPRQPRDYLRTETIANVAIFVVVLTLIAALAISRSPDHLLSPGTIAAMVAIIGLVAGLTGRPIGLFEGAHAALLDDVETPTERRSDDALAPRRMRRRSAAWALGLGAWAGAAGLLVAAVLDGEQAPFLVAAIVLVLVGGTVSVVAGLVGRAEGLVAATAPPPAAPVPLRRRSWREIALPMAIVQGSINAALAVLLFRSYSTGDAFAPRPLTDSVARADGLVVVVILTSLFGFLATRWGRVDAALGRVKVADGDVMGIDAKHPLGYQGLVYVAFGGLVAFTLAGWLLPPLPSLLRVVVVRGVIAGLLAYVVCGVSHVRGALNTLAGAVPTLRRARNVEGAKARLVLGGQLAALLLSFGMVVHTAAVAPRAIADTTAAPQKQLAAEGDAFVARFEYDIPLPASTGTIARVVGRVGPPSGNNSYGLAASPSHLDPVIGGMWANPISDEDPLKPGDQSTGPIPIPDESKIPQVECFYPGNSAQLRFSFPTDARPDLKSAPPIGYATAQCSSGPEADVHSRVAEFGGGASATPQAGALIATGPAGADGLFRPLHGVLEGKANAWAHDVTLLGGAIRIGAVAVDGVSAVTGLAGGQRTLARVHLTDVAIGGTHFSVDGSRLVVAGHAQAIDSSAAAAVLESANAGLAPTGCHVSVVGPTSRYPQGFVLSRKPPPIGTNSDGSLAGSMAGGLLVLCDIPQALSTPTGFNPQRLQILVGFVYTSALATDKVGGFGLGDLVGLPPTSTPAVLPPPAIGPRPTAAPALPAIAGGEPAVAPAQAAPKLDTSPRRQAGTAFRAVAGIFGRWPLWLAALALWMLLTQRGLRRVQQTVVDAAGERTPR